MITRAAALFALLIVILPVSAGDFSISAVEIGKLMVNNTVEQLRNSRYIFQIFDHSYDTLQDIYQNLWGVIYGLLVLQYKNNQITNMALDAMLNDSYTADMSKFGYSGSEKLYDVVGYSVDMVGANSEEVFGDLQGSKGISRLVYSEYYVLKDPNDEFEYDYLGAYATELTLFFYSGVQFFIKLAGAIDEAFT
jgi:hypothetical protein